MKPKAASRPTQSSQHALLELERSTSPPVDLLEEVARILGVGFPSLEKNFFIDEEDLRTNLQRDEDDEILFVRSTFAPKEEWVLRWLLKKTGLANNAGKIKVSEEEVLDMNLDPRTWLLFVFLVCRIPHKVLARTLAESDLPSNFVSRLQNIFNAHEINFLDALADSETLSEPSEAASATFRSKKRKRLGSPSNRRRSTCSEILTCIYRALAHLIQPAGAIETDRTSLQHLRRSLRASPEVAACLLEKLLKGITIIYIGGSQQLHLDSVRHILELWHLSAEDASGSVSNKDEMFTSHCLKPSLALLQLIKSHSGREEAGTSLIQNLERLIALHSILPARALFFAELSSKWRSEEDPIKPDQIEPICDQLRSVLRIDVEMMRCAPLIFDVAVRSMPRDTMRKHQHEQPFLEALFVTLSQIKAKSTPLDFTDHENLHGLAKVALRLKVSVSVPLLAYLTDLSILSVSNVPWPLLASIVELDANIILPGLSTAKSLLDKLCQCIMRAKSAVNYDLIRDDIVISLMKGFGQARDLQRFIETWHPWLTQGIQGEMSSTKLPSSAKAEDVWLDEDVFAAFSNVSKVSMTPAVVKINLERTLEHIQISEKNAENAAMGIAWCAIADSILISRPQDCLKEVSLVQRLLDAVTVLLSRHGLVELEQQRWRLWRVARRIASIIPEAQSLEELLGTSAQSGSVYVSLENRFAHLLEAVECFHLTVCRSMEAHESENLLLRSQVEVLSSIIDNMTLTAENGAVWDPLMWDGRSGSIQSDRQLVAACLGILLQNAQSLSLHQQAARKLLHSLYHYENKATALSADGDELQTFPSMFEAFLTCETVASNNLLLRHCSDAVRDSIKDGQSSQLGDRLIRSTTLQGMNKKLSRGAGALKDAKSTSTSSTQHARWHRIMESAPELIQLVHSRRNISDGALWHSSDQIVSIILSLPSQRSFEHFCLTADYIRMIVTHSPAQINQWTVDNLLQSISVSASSQAPKFESMPDNGASAVFQRLCSLMGILLSRFRKRLGGRYHLVLPAMQGLLRCLFTPILTSSLSSKQARIADLQPPWLVHSPQALDARSTVQYTRLLTSICDPTTSVVKIFSKRAAGNDLTDQTKKAKNIAGQYMQYLVMEYARCRLQGQFSSPDVKAALMPGLYAVLDVMSRDLMRAMNAAMDSSSRAIFKGLYDDYQKFGKWNQN